MKNLRIALSIGVLCSVSVIGSSQTPYVGGPRACSISNPCPNGGICFILGFDETYCQDPSNKELIRSAVRMCSSSEKCPSGEMCQLTHGDSGICVSNSNAGVK
jgi:hypothetical protein